MLLLFKIKPVLLFYFAVDYAYLSCMLCSQNYIYVSDKFNKMEDVKRLNVLGFHVSF